MTMEVAKSQNFGYFIHVYKCYKTGKIINGYVSQYACNMYCCYNIIVYTTGSTSLLAFLSSVVILTYCLMNYIVKGFDL